MSLSVIVITKNEEAAIARTLDSVAWADEIVVVDSGSADRTVEIAQARGAKVVVTPDWPGFGPQKNRALDLATCGWVLSLDADEWLTAASVNEIKAAIGAGAGPAAYRLPRRSSFCGRFMHHSGWWPDHVVRLFRRGSARFSDDSVHEHVIVDGAPGTLREPIMHETFVDLDDLLGKMNHYSTLTRSNCGSRQVQRPRRSGRARAVGVRSHVCVPRRILGWPRRLHARAGHRRRHVLPVREAHAALPQVTARLNVVEPTLEGYSGHCHALVASFARAAASMRIDLWSGKESAAMDFGAHVTVHPTFRRRTRLPQMLLLLRRLLRQPEPILVTTARRIDLALVALAASGRVPHDRVFLYFHWFRETARKLSFLRRIAARQPDIVILGTTDSVVDAFRHGGFANVVLLPYPAPAPAAEIGSVPFRRCSMRARRARTRVSAPSSISSSRSRAEGNIPIAGPDHGGHYGKYDADARADIARLEATRLSAAHAHPRDRLRRRTTPRTFPGSVCLQPYDRAEFRDRVSGVTLDALAHGCPGRATAGTWTAALIERYEAGVALAIADAESLYAAIRTATGRLCAPQPGHAVAARARPNAIAWRPLLDG
jgi:hypothetical protein